MTVYADVLIILNLIVDYFLLKLAGRLAHIEVPLFRHIIAAVLGAVSSLEIFLPPLPTVLMCIIYILPLLVMSGIAYSFRPVKRYLRATVIFIAVSCGYAGGMQAVWRFFKPNGMVVHNSVVYFNISPIFFIAFSVGAYVIILILRHFLERNAPQAEQCEVQLFADKQSVSLNAIVDTGNSLEDVFGMSQIIISDTACAQALFGDLKNNPDIRRRYRALPCNTVSGSEILDGYRCDKAVLVYNGSTKELVQPILAISKTSLGGEYSAIINPKTLYGE